MSEAAKARFRRAFSALPEREREVAVLLYVKNLTLREIGEILGVSESARLPDPFGAEAQAAQRPSGRGGALLRSGLVPVDG